MYTKVDFHMQSFFWVTFVWVQNSFCDWKKCGGYFELLRISIVDTIKKTVVLQLPCVFCFSLLLTTIHQFLCQNKKLVPSKFDDFFSKMYEICLVFFHRLSLWSYMISVLIHGGQPGYSSLTDVFKAQILTEKLKTNTTLLIFHRRSFY